MRTTADHAGDRPEDWTTPGMTLCHNSLDTYVHCTARRSYRGGTSLTGVLVRSSYGHSKQVLAKRVAIQSIRALRGGADNLEGPEGSE